MGGNFDGYWVFKDLTENILTDAQCLLPYISKCCIVFKQFDRLNFDSLTVESIKNIKFPPIKILCYTVTKPHNSMCLHKKSHSISPLCSINITNSTGASSSSIPYYNTTTFTLLWSISKVRSVSTVMTCDRATDYQ